MAFTNGDFETGDLTGWTTGHDTPTVVTTTPHGGTYCLEVTFVDDDIEAHTGSVVQGPFAFTPGGDYSVSLWHRVAVAPDVPGDRQPVRGFKIRFLDANGDPLQDPDDPDYPWVYSAQVFTAVDTNWHQLTSAHTFPESGAALFVFELQGATAPEDWYGVWGDPGDVTYYDDVTLTGDFTDPPAAGGERVQVMWVGL